MSANPLCISPFPSPLLSVPAVWRLSRKRRRVLCERFDCPSAGNVNVRKLATNQITLINGCNGNKKKTRERTIYHRRLQQRRTKQITASCKKRVCQDSDFIETAPTKLRPIFICPPRPIHASLNLSEGGRTGTNKTTLHTWYTFIVVTDSVCDATRQGGRQGMGWYRFVCDAHAKSGWQQEWLAGCLVGAAGATPVDKQSAPRFARWT